MDSSIQQWGFSMANIIGVWMAIVTGVTSYLIDHHGFLLEVAMFNMTLEEFNLVSAVILKWVSIISILGLAVLNWRKVAQKIGLIKYK